VATDWFSHVTPGLGVVIKPSPLGADVRSQARAGQRISAHCTYRALGGPFGSSMLRQGSAGGAAAGDALYMNCPHYRLSIELNPRWLTIRHCSRCMGRNRTLVEPFRSPLPAHLLYADGSLP
jgi:hypothetical protein